MGSDVTAAGARAPIVHADALVHDEAEISALEGLRLECSILSSSAVVEKAEPLIRMIVDTYLGPNKTFPEVRSLMSSRATDPLRAFSEDCRAELPPP